MLATTTTDATLVTAQATATVAATSGGGGDDPEALALLEQRQALLAKSLQHSVFQRYENPLAGPRVRGTGLWEGSSAGGRWMDVFDERPTAGRKEQIAIQQRYDLHNKIKQEKLQKGEFYGESDLPSLASILADLLGRSPSSDGSNDSATQGDGAETAKEFAFDHNAALPTIMVWPQLWASRFTAMATDDPSSADAQITLIEIGSWRREAVPRRELDSFRYVAISHHWRSADATSPWAAARTEQVRSLVSTLARDSQAIHECGGAPPTHYWLDVECVTQDDPASIAVSLAVGPSIYQSAALVYVVTDLDDGDTVDSWADRVWTMRELLLAKKLALNARDASSFSRIYADRLSFYSQVHHFASLGYLLKKNSARSCYDKRDLFYSVFGLNATASALDYRPDETFDQLTVRAARAAVAVGDYSVIALDDPFGVPGLGLLGFTDDFGPDGAGQLADTERDFVEPSSSVGWRNLVKVTTPSREPSTPSSRLSSQTCGGVKLRAKAVPAVPSTQLREYWAGFKDRAEAARELVKDLYMEGYLPADSALGKTGFTPASLLPPSETVEGELDFVPLYAWAARFLQPPVLTMPWGQMVGATLYSTKNVFGLGESEQSFLKKHASSPIALLIVELKMRMYDLQEAKILTLVSPSTLLEEIALLCALVSCDHRHVFGVKKRAYTVKRATASRLMVGWDHKTPFGSFHQAALDAVAQAAMYIIQLVSYTVFPSDLCFRFEYAGGEVAIMKTPGFGDVDTLVVVDGVVAGVKESGRGPGGESVFKVTKNTAWIDLGWLDTLLVVRGAPFARRTPKEFLGSEIVADQYKVLIDLPLRVEHSETVVLA
ncbi:hypothetical protein DFJ73DRAFT_920963 [Zopfochytrium polystomum]|nr:hypothetical protein DFJ73DRAFT_920963 [Zopfochytrium polystomum]